MSNYPTVHWITEGTNLFDYRPAIGPDGKQIIFERTFVQNPHLTQLYTTSIDGGDVTPFLPGTEEQQTRPDWYWPDNKVVFNNNQLWTVDGDGSNCKTIPHSNSFIYAQWNMDGKTLTVMNVNTESAVPNPCTSVIDTDGSMLYDNINGNSGNTPMYGGMPAANPQTLNLVAYAGQPDMENWYPGKTGYLQDYNYIFLNTMNSNSFSSSPMEPGAPVSGYDSAFQGRAPAWSPDGNYILFESTRSGGTFALFLFNVQKQTVVQVTDTSLQAQHGKFFPDGKKIIFCGKPNKETRNRIGWVDVASLL